MSQIEDMKEMIHREIQSIPSLKERVAFKDMMEGVFLALYEKNEEMYRNLEKRVMNDLAYNMNDYQIRTGLVERKYLDVSHHLMAAMCEEDITPSKCTITDIKNGIREEGYFCFSTIFLQADTLEIKHLLGLSKIYIGTVYADKEYCIKVRLEPSRRYLEKIEQLYHLFMKNGIPWQTINAPYLFKMMDLVIVEIADGAKEKEKISKVEVDFEEHNSIVRYDMIPIWNISHLKLESIGFPIACADHENYEHVISIQEYGVEHAYLVEDRAGIQNVRRNGDRLLVTGRIANARKWDIYMIRNGEDYKIDRYAYPIMKNLRKDGFAERFQKKNGHTIKTKGELKRFILGFGLEDYVAYQDCMLEEGGESKETYSMNFFMKDEIWDQQGRRELILLFKPKDKGNWLLRDIISFITSEVQQVYPEFQCGGKLV